MRLLFLLFAAASGRQVHRWPTDAKASGGAIPAPTQILTVDQPVDHFNFEEKRTFKNRYFVYDKHFKAGGPMFFYTGNEGPLESFWYNTGLPFDWAEEFGAMVIFGEHRFYGDSKPFGDQSFTKENLGFLSIHQALADFALMVSTLKQQYNINQVVAFGGSYGGMLSAWVRIKYPNVFDMALAASSPIPQMTNNIPADRFFKLLTQDAANADPACPDRVRAGFAQVIELSKTPEGRKKISDTFQLCKTMEESELDHFIQYARNAWTEMAMCDYPYASSFLAPLPAFPVNAACKAIAEKHDDPLAGLAAAVAMPYKTDAQCFDMYTIFIECADQTGCGTGDDAKAWDYQMCTEIFYEQTTNNVSDMFPPRKWTMAKLNDYCTKHYGVVPKQDWSNIALGGTNAEDMAKVSSQIIWSNGLLDPWHGGGFLIDVSESQPAVIIADGAHHLDLRLSNTEDPQSVIDARLKEKKIFKAWLAGQPTPSSSEEAIIV